MQRIVIHASHWQSKLPKWLVIQNKCFPIAGKYLCFGSNCHLATWSTCFFPLKSSQMVKLSWMDVFSIYNHEKVKMYFSEGQWKVFRKDQNGFEQISFVPLKKSFHLLLYLQMESVCSEFSSTAGLQDFSSKAVNGNKLTSGPETISFCWSEF